MGESDMLETARGDLLKADVDALVNTVNTVGVMGKGIALQFKRAYPEMFRQYERACKAGDVQVGKMHVWPTGQLTGPRFIINFPTKRHWKGKSQMSWIDAGLADLATVIHEHQIVSIAVPPLGAGNGRLSWPDVRSHIEASLGGLDEVRVLVFEPVGAPPAAEMSRQVKEPLTVGRAALIAIIRGYLLTAFEASQVEVQKLMYFLQLAGEPLKLQFAQARYGPYANNLRHVLSRLEGGYIQGFGDGSRPVLEADPITLLDGAEDAAEEFLVGHPDTRERIDRVLDTIQGYDSMYGMELLATVHWAATQGVPGSPDDQAVVRYVQHWSQRKKDLFTSRHISIALAHLRAKRWLPQQMV
jgi:O-acetyl-ADP-ribose deacetylase (regulator of RNase III)